MHSFTPRKASSENQTLLIVGGIIGGLALVGASFAVGIGAGGVGNPLTNGQNQQVADLHDPKVQQIRNDLVAKIDSCASLLASQPAVQSLSIHVSALPDTYSNLSKDKNDALRALAAPISADLNTLLKAANDCTATSKTNVNIAATWQRVQDNAGQLLASGIITDKTISGSINGNSETEDTGDDGDKTIGYDGVPIIFQRDFKNVPYPKSGVTGDTSTISSAGCGIVATAMVLQFYNIPGSDVATLAQFALAGGYRGTGRPGDAGTRYSFFPAIAKNKSLQYANLGLGDSDASWKKITDALTAHHPVIVSGMGKSPYSAAGHYVVLTGINTDGTINVNNPSPHTTDPVSYTAAAIRNGMESAQVIFKP